MSVLTKAQMEAVYQRNCDMIYRICLMHLKHEQDALDAVSETSGLYKTESSGGKPVRSRNRRKISIFDFKIIIVMSDTHNVNKEIWPFFLAKRLLACKTKRPDFFFNTYIHFYKNHHNKCLFT